METLHPVSNQPLGKEQGRAPVSSSYSSSKRNLLLVLGVGGVGSGSLWGGLKCPVLGMGTLRQIHTAAAFRASPSDGERQVRKLIIIIRREKCRGTQRAVAHTHIESEGQRVGPATVSEICCRHRTNISQQMSRDTQMF